MSMTPIFENYETFLKSHESVFSSPKDVARMMTDESMFNAYVDHLTEGLSPSVRSTVTNVLNRQKMMLLTEGANVGASSLAQGWSVASFPILVDIYSEPIIAK